MAEINNDFVLSGLKNSFGEAILSNEEQYGMLSVEVQAEKVAEIALWLRDHENIAMNFLTDICGVHFPENTGKELGAVYHLHSWTNNYRLRLKAFCSISQPNVPTLTTVFASANWMERETFDFYGIQFEGHPDLRRILNMDEMDYHPLRKEYALEDETREDKDDRYFGR
jgi:NADH-quinone oxidoreductase subunit C